MVNLFHSSIKLKIHDGIKIINLRLYEDINLIKNLNFISFKMSFMQEEISRLIFKLVKSLRSFKGMRKYNKWEQEKKEERTKP